MITNQTQRHTARPSRSRVMRARVGAWLDRHPALSLAIVGALVVVLLNALMLFAMMSDGLTVSDALGASGTSLVITAVAVLIAVMATHEHTTDKVARSHSRAFSRVIREHDADMARAIGTRHASTMSAYEMSAELARLAERETVLRHALRVKVRA